MPLNSAHDERFPAHYNHYLLHWRRIQLGYSIRAIARLLGYHSSVMDDVFHGRATSKTVYPVALFLGLDWAKVHDLTLVESDYPQCLRIAHLRGPQLIAPQQTVSNST